MGTKVHYTNCLPGLCTMRDLNEHSEDFLSQYYNDKPTGINLCSGYQLGPSNRYSEFDKEMIKRTMLEHEAIFRKQVYELHRLYRIQKEMMDELKKGPHGVETSQSNSFSSQIPSEGSSKMFQLARMPEATTSNNRAPLTITDDRKPSLNFLNESRLQSGTVFTGKEIAPKDGDRLDSNRKELPKRMFDLQLSAEVYIDCEEEERSGKEIAAVTRVPLDRTEDVEPGNNVKLTLCTNEVPNCKKDKSVMQTPSVPFTRNFSDLNEPAREMCFEKSAGSVSAKCLGTTTPLAENQGLQSSMRSHSSLSGLRTAFLKGRHSEIVANSNCLRADYNETTRKLPLFNNEAGQSTSSMKLFSLDSSKEKFSMPSEQIQLNQKPHEVVSIDPNRTLPWFKPKLDARRGPQCGQSAAALPNSYSDPYLDHTISSSPLPSSWTKPVNGCSHVPLAVPPHQTFLGSATQSQGNSSDKWRCSGDLRSRYTVGRDLTSYRNGFNHGIRFDYNSASQLHMPPLGFGKPNVSGGNDHNPEGCGPHKPQKDVHLNQRLLNGLRDGVTTQKVNESRQECEDSSGALSWLKRTPSCNASSLMELDYSRGYPQLKASCSVMNAGYKRRQETETSINFFNLQDLPSSSQVKETTAERSVASEGQNSERLFGFAISARTQQSAATAFCEEKTTVAAKYDEKDKLKLSIVETQSAAGDQVTKSSSLKNRINLNFDLNSSDFSAEGEMSDVPLQASAPTIASRIDLEAPVVLEEEQQDEVLVMEAAENILWISLDKRSHLDKMDPSSADSFNVLHWFAEVASSNAEIVKETFDDGSDTFEQLTLELEETKPEEYWCWSKDGQDQKEEDGDDEGKSNFASLLFTKPRRGQQRKRRQKRDFQRDILPGLVSLSRHEVTEDFQTIGALMRAAGLPWQAGGTTRRNGNRNGTNARGRMGRKPRSLARIVEETQVSPPPPTPQLAVVQPASNSEVEVDGKNMIGWGRTTRRCRRQRLPPVANVAAPLT